MSAPALAPRRVLAVALDRPLPRLEASDRGRTWPAARVLVRLHGHPLGVLDLDLPAGGLDPAALAARIAAELGAELAAHLAADGLAPPPDLAEGIGGPAAGCARDVPQSGTAAAASVVVATRDRPETLLPCLESLLSGNALPAEVVVVDNAPDRPRTRAAIEERFAAEPRVRYVAEPRPGIVPARNRGLADARGEIVAFLDDDVVVDPDWLVRLGGAFGAAEDVTAVTTLILPLELETPAQLWLEEYGGYAKGVHRRIFDLGDHRDPGPLYPYAPGLFGSGASMAFRTATLRAQGGLDPALGHGGEDLDLFLRTVLGGQRLVYEPAAVVWHRHPREYAALQRTMSAYGTGLTAVMTKWALTRPGTAVAILARLPAAARLALHPASAKNAGKGPGFPRELTWRERRGMLLGPFAFVRSARAARRAAAPLVPVR